VGISKPDKRIFQLTLNQLKIKPQEAIHVGDWYYSDVIGAERAGMEALLFDHLDAFNEFPCRRINRLSEVIHFLEDKE
jgi:putative hydrolase of the HAD superfamily